MPKYFYTAKTADGKTVKGDSIAESTHELFQKLKDSNLILITALQEGAKGKNLFNLSILGNVPVIENDKKLVCNGVHRSLFGKQF